VSQRLYSYLHLQGTWQFMSTRLLTNPGSKYTITDDLESHYFVLMWTALHWVKHSSLTQASIWNIFSISNDHYQVGSSRAVQEK
jgi:hypothetical protein